jgi:hypothetical protein
MNDWMTNRTRRVKNWCKENPKRKWIIPSTATFLLIWILLLLKFIEFNLFTIALTAVLVLIFIVELFWDIIRNNVIVFLEKGNIFKTIVLGVFIFLTFFVAHYVVVLGKFNNQNYILTFTLTVSAILLTIMGIFVSARVLMVINKSQTTEISDWISLTTEIVEEAEGSNIVYIVAPTFCAGLTNPKTAKMLDKLYKKLEYKKAKNVNFRCAFLQTNFKHSHKFDEWTDTKVDYFKQELNDVHWDCMYKYFRKKEHNEKIGTENRVKHIKETYETLSVWYEKIKNIVQNEKHLHQLKATYLEDRYETDSINSFSGFFVSANISKGRYYLGTFNHDGIKTTFDGTEFCNKHIRDKMDKFILNIIQNYSV